MTDNIKPPQYTDDIDLDNYIYQASIYADLAQTDEERSETDTLFKLLLKVQSNTLMTWFRSLKPRPKNVKEFTEKMKEHLAPVNEEENARKKLFSSKQTGTVSDYIKHMRQLRVILPDVNEKDVVFAFTQGLKHDLCMEVTRANPETFNEACAIATRMEGLYDNCRPNQPVLPTNAVTMMPKPKKLTEEERAKCIREGRCFSCRQPGHSFPECTVRFYSRSTRNNPPASQQGN